MKEWNVKIDITHEKNIRPEPYKLHLVLHYMDARIQMRFQNEFDSILKG